MAILEATVKEMWLSQGKANFMRNLPASWSAGVAALRQAGIVDLQNPTILYANEFVDRALSA